MKNSKLHLALITLGFAATCAAQVPLRTINGSAANDFFGTAAKIAGDVDNDGFDDLIIGGPFNDAGGADAGCALVVSGVDGSILHTFIGNPGEHLGAAVDGAGDVDADGFDDVIVGAPEANPNGALSGRAIVYSGANGSVLFTFDGPLAGDQAGFSVAGLGDTNADGFDDVIVGAPFRSTFGAPNVGFAFVYSGLDGSLLHLATGDAGGDNGGYAVGGPGDVNGDGRADFMIGAPNGTVQMGPANAGWIRVMSGLSGISLGQTGGSNTGDLYGSVVSGAGDVNGDGRDDVIVGARGANSFSGYAEVVDPFDGIVLYTINGMMGEQLGTSVGGGGDIDGDGRDDFVVTAREEAFGRILAFSGVDGSLIMEWANSLVGANAATGGDVDGDGYADVLGGNPFDFPNGAFSGSAVVYSGVTALTELFPGTDDDLLLELGVDGPADAKSVKLARPLLPSVGEITSPMGTFTGAQCLILVQLYATGTPAPSFPGFPQVHMTAAGVLIAFDGALPANGLSFTNTTPAGLDGASLIFQAIALSTQAANGFLAASDAQEIRFIQ